jgi:hypothetical protein
LSSVPIDVDRSLIWSLIETLKEAKSNHSVLDVLNSADDDVVGQMLISLLTIINEMNYAGASTNDLSSENIEIRDTFVDHLSITSPDKAIFKMDCVLVVQSS